MVETPQNPSAPEPPSDVRAGLAAGRAEAIDAIATMYFADLQRYARSLLGECDLVFDAVQETFLCLLERHRLYDPTRSLRPWLFAICRNCALAQRRRRNSQEARVVSLETTEAEVEQLASETPDALAVLLRSESDARAEALLATLGEEQREVLVLHLFEGFTFREVAELTGRPLNTVAAIHYRALKRLRRQLEADATGRSHHAG